MVVVQHDEKTIHVLNENHEDSLTENHLQTWSCLLLFLLFSTKDLSIYLSALAGCPRQGSDSLFTVHGCPGQVEADYRISGVTGRQEEEDAQEDY